jgi:DNA (cytosine-5)-methyltransferase 1
MVRVAQPVLALKTRPEFESGHASLRVADLFCGCGGITLGIAQAARAANVALEIPLAVDFEPTATAIYSANFPKANSMTAAVDELFEPSTGLALSSREKQLAEATGDVTVLVGGPPCQGHSDLNNHTRRADPKNALYSYMARAAEVLRPQVVLIENVPAVQHDRHAGEGVVSRVAKDLAELGYLVETRVVPLVGLGIAQRRKRHVLLALQDGLLEPGPILDAITGMNEIRDLRWAIEDLVGADPVGLDMPPRASADNLRRMNYLAAHQIVDLPNDQRPACHQKDGHSYKSMYGRLSWGLPAQTITSGFGSIGQGRYMHPSELRALTAHEAARIQGFPDYYDFSPVTRRGSLATMIGNAVPPQLGLSIFSHLLPHLALSA